VEAQHSLLAAVLSVCRLSANTSLFAISQLLPMSPSNYIYLFTKDLFALIMLEAGIFFVKFEIVTKFCDTLDKY